THKIKTHFRSALFANQFVIQSRESFARYLEPIFKRFKLLYVCFDVLLGHGYPLTFFSSLGAGATSPRLRNSGSTLGSAPRNLLYNSIGSSLPPFSKIFFRNLSASSGLNNSVVLNASNASVS